MEVDGAVLKAAQACAARPSKKRPHFWATMARLLYPVDGLPESAPLSVREVDLRGCTRETEAARILRHLTEQARALPFRAHGRGTRASCTSRRATSSR